MKIYVVIENSGYVSEMKNQVFLDKEKSLDEFNRLVDEAKISIRNLLNNGTSKEEINEDEVLSAKCKTFSYDDTEVCQQVTWEEHTVE